ncbi:unnamed protein product [Macrosiphum euphorbiae]|uniref:MADF domain-containing protein n=1 Tax=Macrosiphum euphorbiae TaxID=13131 RepID=A0AAV0W9L3_9HEMI|nr:unnamed protein product [Macrosiphum euphorbiae]
MEWSNEQIAQFLELYEGEPSIWNLSDANHKIRNHVHDAWGRISKNLSGAEYSISELKKKDSLMGTYRKMSLKGKASKKTGSGTDGIFNITRHHKLIWHLHLALGHHQNIQIYDHITRHNKLI